MFLNTPRFVTVGIGPIGKILWIVTGIVVL